MRRAEKLGGSEREVARGWWWRLEGNVAGKRAERRRAQCAIQIHPEIITD